MPAGQLILDGVALELARDPGRPGGFVWATHVAATLPGQTDPDEAKVARAPAEIRRTIPLLDWSSGIGAAKVVTGHPTRRLHYSEGASGRHPGRLTRGHEIRTVTPNSGGGTVSDFFEVNSRLYAVIGPTVRRVTPTLNAETVADRTADGVGSGDATGVYVSGLTFTVGSPLWYNSSATLVYVGTTAASKYLVSFDGTATWVQDADVALAYMALSQGTDGQRLWAGSGSGDTNGVYVWNLPQASNPFTIGSWSSKFSLANRQDLITGMAALRDGVIVTTGDGQIWRFDYATGLPTPLLNSDGLVPSTSAGLQMGVWNGTLVVPTPRGLLLYSEQTTGPGTFMAIGPEHLIGHEMPVRGVCSALYCGDPQYLWAAFYNGTDSYVLAGRLPNSEEQAQGLRLVWDTLGVGRLASRKVTALHITHLESTLGQPILCLGTSTPDLSFVTLPLPLWTELQDASCRSRVTAHSTYLPDVDGGAPTTSKAWRRLRFKTIGLSASETLTVSARVDRGTYATMGTVQDSPLAAIRLPTGIEGMSLGVQLTWAGTTALATYPQLEGIEIDCTERPEPSRWIDVGLWLAQQQETLEGAAPSNVVTVTGWLRLLAEQVTPVTAKGPDDQLLLVSVDPFTGIHSDLAEAVPGRTPGYLVRFRLNVYDDLVTHPAGRYGLDPFTGAGKTTYYG